MLLVLRYVDSCMQEVGLTWDWSALQPGPTIVSSQHATVTQPLQQWRADLCGGVGSMSDDCPDKRQRQQTAELHTSQFGEQYHP